MNLINDLLRLAVSQRVEYVEKLKGKQLFIPRSDSDIHTQKNIVMAIQEQLGITFPIDYIEFYSEFEVKPWIGEFLNLPEDFCEGRIFYNKSERVKLNFTYLLPGDEILGQWQNIVQYEQEDYAWDLIKIANSIWQGGYYLGYGSNNFGKIYWIRSEFIPDDFKLDNLSSKMSDFIRLVANNFSEFLEGLQYNFSELPKY